MPSIMPLGVDIPPGAVTQAWYVEATNSVGLGGWATVLEVTATIPAGSAVLHLYAADVSRTSLGVTGHALVRLSAGDNVTASYPVSGMYQGMRRHNFAQHLWLNLPAGTHTFRAEMARDGDSSGASVHDRMMALLLLKR